MSPGGGVPIPDTTSVDICNIALEGYLGLAPITTIDDAINTARVCKRMYPQCRDELLRAHDWGFARARAVLVERTMPVALEDVWEFAYTLPTDVARILRVVSPISSKSDDFKVMLDQDVATPVKIIVTNTEDAHLLYTAKVTDAASMDATFKNLLAVFLASRIATPLAQSSQRMQELAAQYLRAFSDATMVDVREDESGAEREALLVASGIDTARFG